MPKKYYMTKDVLKKVGISRATLYLWLRKGKVPEAARDRNNAREFTCGDINAILAYKNKRVPPQNNGH